VAIQQPIIVLTASIPNNQMRQLPAMVVTTPYNPKIIIHLYVEFLIELGLKYSVNYYTPVTYSIGT
jgi:hypothetical protein